MTISTAPARRGMLSSCTGTRIRPKWSTTIEAITCPAKIREHVQRPKESADPRPPRSTSDHLTQRPRLAQGQRNHDQRERPAEEGDGRRNRGTIHKAAQHGVDAELHQQSRSSHEREQQHKSGHALHPPRSSSFFLLNSAPNSTKSGRAGRGSGVACCLTWLRAP